MNRREFLTGVISLAAASPLLLSAARAADDFWRQPRELHLVRQETGEAVRAVYWQDGQYQLDGYKRLCWLLRDLREGDAVWMDPNLLDVLYGVSGWLARNGYRQPVYATSGYRSKRTNAWLRSKGEPAALNSLHLYGKATDAHIPGVEPSMLAAMGRHIGAGGIGYYPRKGMVHFDSGQARTWVG